MAALSALWLVLNAPAREDADLYGVGQLAAYRAGDAFSDAPPVTQITVDGTAIASFRDLWGDKHTEPGVNPAWRQGGQHPYADFTGNRRHNLPAAFALDPQNFSCALVLARTVGVDVGLFDRQIGGLAYQVYGSRTPVTSDLWTGNSASNYVALPFAAPAGQDYVVALSGSGSRIVALQNLQAFTAHYLGFVVDASWASRLWMLFVDTSNHYFRGTVRRMYFWTQAQTAAQLASTVRYLRGEEGLPALTSPTRNVVCKGDSLTQASDSSGGVYDFDSWPAALVRNAALGPERFALVNAGRSGQRLGVAAADPSMITSYAEDVAPYYDARAVTNILCLHAGTNDLGGSSRTAAQLEADLVTYVATARAGGWKVIVSTLLPRADYASGSWDAAAAGVKEGHRVAFNTWLRANWATTVGANGLCDLAADPAFNDENANPAVDALDATYYRTDALHLTDAGYRLMGSLFKTQLDALA